MGSQENYFEEPIHKITFNYNFELAKYQVTFEEYDKFCEATSTIKPSDEGWGRGERPVINVTWYEAKKYCEWLSKVSGENYRLPTEAEWEYSCRAGNNSNYFFGDDEKNLIEYAWYDKNSGGKTHEVGQLKPNNWGLYDMYGNVWEWCEDWFCRYGKTPIDGSASGKSDDERQYKILRGGSFENLEGFYSASRYWFNANFSDNHKGFRVAKVW